MKNYDLSTRDGLAGWIGDHIKAVIREGQWDAGDYRWIIACPWNEAHTDKAAYVVRHTSGAIAAGCRHNSCQGKSWHDLRDVVEPGWRSRAHAETPQHKDRLPIEAIVRAASSFTPVSIFSLTMTM